MNAMNTAPQPKAKQVIIYADGACSPNPGKGGYSAILIGGGKRLEVSGGFRNTTNNRMELYSVIAGLKSLKQYCLTVTIYSDSKYVVDMYTGGHARKWKANRWYRGRKPAKNPDLWDELLTLCDKHKVRFLWIKGHDDNNDHPENARCDELAVKARQGDNLPVDEGYENPVNIMSYKLTLFDE